MNKKQHIIITVLTVIALILAFMLSTKVYLRFDLTRNRTYTLSLQSRNLHRELEDTLRITYFVSDRLLSSHPLSAEISGFLREYAAHSRGMIQLIQMDPARVNLTWELEELGIVPQTMRIMDRNEISTVAVYSSILIEYLDRYEVMPLVFSLETLEYDLSSRIISLARDRDRIVGIIVGNSQKQWEMDYNLLDFELRRAGYNIRHIIAGEAIPDNLPLLFILGGIEEFDDWALYRIDRFIQMGGRVLFALDSLSVDLMQGLEINLVPDQGLLAMVASYGGVVLPAMILDRSSLQISYQVNPADVLTVPYPHWIIVQEQNGNPQHPITLNFNGLYLYWTSPLELHPPEAVSAEPLFFSSPQAWLQTRDFNANPEDPYLLELEEAESKGTRILGAALSGTFPGFFQGLPKPEREGYPGDLPDMPALAQPSRIVVVGNCEFATSMMEIGRGEARNLDFLLRTADWLINDEDIISIRQGGPGRLDRIRDHAQRQRAMDFSLRLNVFLLPLLLIFFGVYITGKRKKKTKGRKTHGL